MRACSARGSQACFSVSRGRFHARLCCWCSPLRRSSACAFANCATHSPTPHPLAVISQYRLTTGRPTTVSFTIYSGCCPRSLNSSYAQSCWSQHASFRHNLRISSRAPAHHNDACRRRRRACAAHELHNIDQHSRRIYARCNTYLSISSAHLRAYAT